jgi:signal transduction histidine kinase/ligand-binding sensor domain-containing protein
MLDSPSCASALVSFALLATQELSFRSWSVDEGLPHERVATLFEDSRGALWIGTFDGLACFDGASFRHFGRADGLAVGLAFAIAEDPRGDLWVECHTRGLARLDLTTPRRPGEPLARVFRIADEPLASDILAIAFDGPERAWIATAMGLFRMHVGPHGEPTFELRRRSATPWGVQSVWRSAGLVRFLSGSERIEVAGEELLCAAGAGSDPGFDVAAEPAPDGRAMLVAAEGLFEFIPPDRFERLELGLPDDVRVKATAYGVDGARWIGTTRGLYRSDATGLARHDRASGLPSESISSLHVDRAGWLWIGTNGGGLAALAPDSIVTFVRQPTGEPVDVKSLVATHDGVILAATSSTGVYTVGERGLELLPGSSDPPFERTEGFLFADPAHALWVGTAAGLRRLAGPAPSFLEADALLLPGRTHGPARADAQGRVWVSADPHAIYAGSGAEAFEPVLDWPDPADAVREVFFDSGGRCWILGWQGLWRRADATTEEVRVDGAPPQARAILQDRRGWLWLGLRYGGVAWTHDPAADAPRFERLTTQDGLPSDTAWALDEDGHGDLWIGTGRGLARFDPEARALATWTIVDGLKGGAVASVLCAADGTVWAATSHGVVRLHPDRARAPSPPPRAYVIGMEAGGEALPLPARGSETVSGIELPAGKNNVSVRFGGVDLLRGQALAFQTRLAGMDEGWNAPSAERSVHLAHLAPGRYRLLVRAVARDGTSAAEWAEVSFRLLAPVWQRPWFLALVAMGIGLTAWGLQRARLARRAALERVRAGIAADLHDEVGSGLTQISILAEVARREVAGPASGRLGRVAEIARTTRVSMSDLVWAIDPEKDRLADLVARVRAATSVLFDPLGVDLVLRAPSDAEAQHVELGPDVRRELLLFFKEAATNAARHAHAARVEIELRLAGQDLELCVRDDGRGFDPAAPATGHGLPGLRRRAERLGARLTIDSTPGRGTEIRLALALARLSP